MSECIQEIADMGNIRLAYLKARKGKQRRIDAVEFSKNLDNNLLELRRQILKGHLEVGDYNLFYVYDPKKRLICAAAFRERVLHHALMNICEPAFEACQPDSSFACRKGKGLYAALERAFVLSNHHSWYLKIDVRHFFETIPHSVLKEKLDILFCDSLLMNLFEQIISSYESMPGQGLPIGNLTSQFFANYYLSYADRFISEQLGFEAYIRYMDDIIIWHDEKNVLLKSVDTITQYFKNNLLLMLKPICLNRTSYGLPFLGHLIYPDTITLNRRSRKRYAKRLEHAYSRLTSGMWTQEDFARHTGPLIAFTETANSVEFRKNIQRRFGCRSQVRTA